VLGGVSTHSFLEDLPAKLGASDAVVGMAGYNTTAEILQSGVPAVLLPRTSPRREQELRASRLARLGLAQSLPHPTPETLRGALETALTRRPARTVSLQLDGAARICAIARELLEAVHGRNQGALVA
jgi:predicted glycosyltransferase